MKRAPKSNAAEAAPCLAVYDGQTCVGHILARGKAGHEATDPDDQSLGTFATVKAAADAILAAAMRRRIVP
jgi:hypothetical protein